MVEVETDFRTQNVMELTQNRLEQARIDAEKRRLADKQREVMDQLEEVKAEVKTEPTYDQDFPPLSTTPAKGTVREEGALQDFLTCEHRLMQKKRLAF